MSTSAKDLLHSALSQAHDSTGSVVALWEVDDLCHDTVRLLLRSLELQAAVLGADLKEHVPAYLASQQMTLETAFADGHPIVTREFRERFLDAMAFVGAYHAREKDLVAGLESPAVLSSLVSLLYPLVLLLAEETGQDPFDVVKDL